MYDRRTFIDTFTQLCLCGCFVETTKLHCEQDTTRQTGINIKKSERNKRGMIRTNWNTSNRQDSGMRKQIQLVWSNCPLRHCHLWASSSPVLRHLSITFWYWFYRKEKTHLNGIPLQASTVTGQRTGMRWEGDDHDDQKEGRLFFFLVLPLMDIWLLFDSFGIYNLVLSICQSSPPNHPLDTSSIILLRPY